MRSAIGTRMKRALNANKPFGLCLFAIKMCPLPDGYISLVGGIVAAIHKLRTLRVGQ